MLCRRFGGGGQEAARRSVCCRSWRDAGAQGLERVQRRQRKGGEEAQVRRTGDCQTGQAGARAARSQARRRTVLLWRPVSSLGQLTTTNIADLMLQANDSGPGAVCQSIACPGAQAPKLAACRRDPGICALTGRLSRSPRHFAGKHQWLCQHPSTGRPAPQDRCSGYIVVVDRRIRQPRKRQVNQEKGQRSSRKGV